MRENNKIVLELNQISQNREIENLLTDSIEELIDIILKRVKQADEKINNQFKTDSREFFELAKEHDSILIDGTRGTGKTTVIRNLKKFLNYDQYIEEKRSVKILPIIDPNYIDNSANILSIIVRVIFDNVKKNGIESNHSKFRKICELKDEIDEIIFTASKSKYDDSIENSKVVKGEMDLDYTIHKFASKACESFGVKALILPIDDIDMSIEHGNKIVETLRRYMQTPSIIPIIALDSAQIYALIKKEYFSKFGYKASKPLNKIDNSSELTFLQKLPSEYIQKILPPAQRVILPDMLGHYKNHLNAMKNPNSKYKHIFFKFSKEHNREWEIEWSFDQLLKVLMNILFGYDGKEILDSNDYHVVNYLKNKTFRSFLDDVKALMRAMVQNKNNRNLYSVDMQIIKDRFKLPSRATASSKYDATLWFWKRYIGKLYTNLEDFRVKKDLFKNDDFKINLVEEILTVTPEDAKDLGRKGKIYYRLYMQDYFIDKVYIIDENNILIHKKINVFGLIEFVLRTLFPALQFEHFINYQFISLDSFPVEKLTEFSNTNVHTTLIELYDNFIPSWIDEYGSSKIKANDNRKHNTYKQLCILNKVFQSDRNDILHYKTFYNFSNYVQNYYLHPYKFWVFFSELDKFINLYRDQKNRSAALDSLISKFIPKSSKSKIPTSEIHIKFKRNFNIYRSTNINCDFYNSKIGVLSLIKIIDQIVKNLSIINSNLIDFQYFKKQLADMELNLEDNMLNFLYKKEIERYLALMESVFINGLIIYFLKNGDIGIKNFQNIEEDHIISGTSKTDLFKFTIVDNSFLRNLKLILELKNGHIKNLQQLLFTYIDINSGNIKKLYIFDDKITEVFNIYRNNNYTSKEDAIKRKTEDVLENIEIYSKLFDKYISKDFNYKNIKIAIEQAKASKKYIIVTDTINELRINSIDDNIERNLKEMMVYLVAYQGDKVQNYLIYT